MPRIRNVSLPAIAVLLCASPAFADEPVPGRYSMQPVPGGVARLDTQTGEVSLCQLKQAELVCHIAADERAAFELELDLLSKRVETLEKADENDLTALKPRLPTQEEIDQTMTVMKGLMRSFMGIVKDLEKSAEPPASDAPGEPSRT